MRRSLSRRDFIKTTSTAAASLGAGLYASGSPARAANSANEKLNIAIIGVWGRGRANIKGVLGANENIVALCDIDERNFGKARKQYPQTEKAKLFQDWRKVCEEKSIDAVVISTADQVHALAAVKAMRMGKHVYCEKPLAHSVHEARTVREVYKQSGVATQMGTQIHATDNYRRIVELVQSGAIGPVREAHVWCSRTIKRLKPLTGKPPIPERLHWDLWLGPAPDRQYHPGYLPGNLNWNRRWDFGNGVLGDMGSHLIDLPFWALNLKQPETVSAEGPSPDPVANPPWMIVTWTHAARAGNESLNVPLTLKWYHGGRQYRPKIETGIDLSKWFNGILFVGDKGMLLADYRRRVLLPEGRFEGFTAPKPSIPASLGHYKEWIHAAKTGSPTLCNFEYSGALVEHNLLGNVAFRTGETLQWNPKTLKATNCAEAEPIIRREYRKGWTI